MEIYYWVYPYRRQVVLKGAAKIALGRPGMLLGSILKFFPVGFWIVWERPPNARIRLRQLLPDRETKLDATRQLHIELRLIPPGDYPEAPADDEIVLFSNEQTSVGEPRRR